MPEILYDTQEAVPQDFRDKAVAKDGKFAINVVLDEFRNNNLALSQERDKLNGTIGKFTTEVGFDPEKADDFITEIKDLRSVRQQVEDGKLIKDTSLEEAVSRKTTEMRKQHDTQVNALTTSVNNLKNENQQLRDRLDDNILVNDVSSAALNERSGIRPDAVEAVVDQARKFFKVREGKLVALDSQNSVIYGADGTSPMSPMEWIKTKLAERAPYLFKESRGGGSQGGTGVGGLSPEQLAALPPAERMRLARQNG
jgi:hypothetical protein